MYAKILVPFDHSPESESILPIVQELLFKGGDGILLHIVSPDTPGVFDSIVDASQQVVNRLAEAPGRWRFEVAVSDSVADEIVETAAREQVDLIAMYTHDRKGLAKLSQGSTAEEVRERATTEVQIFGPET